ncbi:hypothetical protein ABKN59_011452 [Abortiporus biennis]
MPGQLNQEEEDLLQSALTSAFGDVEVQQVSPISPTKGKEITSTSTAASPPPSESTPTAPISSTASSIEEKWKDEYEDNLKQWRRQSAEQRAKAEDVRRHWEEIRESELKEGKKSDLDLSGNPVGSGWERLSASVASSVVGHNTGSEEPSVADARDLVSGEGQGRKTKEQLETILPGEPLTTTSSPPEGSGHEAESSKHDKWEDVPSSMTSSYPSMSFPSDPHSPSSSHHHKLPPHRHEHDHDHRHHQGYAHAEERAVAGPGGPTFAIFDSSLSTKTRVLALFSSLAINVLLPFVNGVMLGFGEIFARNVVVGWFGWKRPGGVAASAGLGSTRSRRV